MARFYLFLFIIVAALSGVFFFLRTTQAKPEYSVNTKGSAVVKQLQLLSRFETAQFTIEKIIDAGTSGNVFSEFLFGDKILLIANGVVIAGFDFATLSENDVKVTGDSLSVTLPAPQILLTKLDNDQTRVYDRKQGILTHGSKDLEANARLVAESEITKAACTEKILTKASENARTQLTAVLKSLGFVSVTISIPAASC